MSDTGGKEKNEHKVNSVPYTKAGLANKKNESGGENENEGDEQKSSRSTEQTPKISKEKSTERDREKPIH